MGRHKQTAELIEAAIEVLFEHHPMTVRQVYYQLVSRQVLENNIGRYKATCAALVAARKDGDIPWEWIEDRLRRPRCVSMWNNLADFGDTACAAYRRDVWASQPSYFETWLEKDALSGIFEDELSRYGVTLNVGRGYDGWSSIREAAERYGDDRHVDVIYFGDFDPSGEDMARSLKERLTWFGCHVGMTKVALTRDDIEHYHLPPDVTKASDTRRDKFVAQHGDVSVELDALPIDALRDRIRQEVERRMDLEALGEVRAMETAERQQLREMLEG
jgi:hypothetical protein